MNPKNYEKKLKQIKYYLSKSTYTNVNENSYNWNKMKIFNWLTNATVVELDVESPNYLSTNKIMWSKWRVRGGTQGQSEMTIQTVTHSRWYCTSCGLRLKNVPFYNVGNSRVCIPCLHLRLDNIKTVYERMPEDFRTSITNELIIGSL
jgi:hypothetical protein